MAENLQSIKKAMHDLFGGHQKRNATPERKERRRIVKIGGRRQAVKHFKDMRVINKLKEANHE